MESNKTLQMAEQLRDAITQSEEYIDYQKCAEELKAEPELWNAVCEYRKQHFMLQNGHGGRVSYEDYNNFANRSRELRKNPVVSNFLDAEVGFCKLIQDVNRTVMAGVEFDTDFLN